MRWLWVLLFAVFCNQILSQGFEQTGKASYYANKFEGRPTASGELFSNSKLTAAHKSLAFGTKVVVTNLNNQKTVLVTINDRGPFIRGRIIDLSQTAARVLGFINDGITNVRIEIARQKLGKDELLLPMNSKTFRFKSVNIDYMSMKLR